MARLKPPDTRVEFGDTIEDTRVPDNLAISRSKLKPVKARLDKMYGVGKWGLEEAKLYVAQAEWTKKIAWEAAQSAGVEDGITPRAVVTTKRRKPTAPSTEISLPPPTAATEAEVEAAVELIMANFPDLSEANRPMVRQREYYNRSLVLLAIRFNAALAGTGDSTNIRQIQQMMTEIQREVRQIETTLGLDAGSLRAGGKEEIREEVMKVMDRSKAMLDKHAIRIFCPACRNSVAERHINLGYFLYHFRQDNPFHWFCVCPHPDCGLGIHIYGGPGQPTVIENGTRTIGPLEG